MIGTQKNKLLLARYLDVTSEKYEDVPPEQEVIIGTFANNEKQDEYPEDLTSVVPSGSRNKTRKVKPVIKRTNKNDIRSFFAKNTANDNESTQAIVEANDNESTQPIVAASGRESTQATVVAAPADTATDFHVHEPIIVVVID